MISSLTLEPNKTILITKAPDLGRINFPEYQSLKLNETTRYLEIEIGMHNLYDKNWNKIITTLQKRLIIITQFKSHFRRDAEIIKSITIPKLLFTAQFIKPNPNIIIQLKNY